jgi:hypothetical protein
MRILPSVGAAALALALILVSTPGCAVFVEYGSESQMGVGLRGTVPMDRIISREDQAGGGTLSRLEIAGSGHRSWPSDGTWTQGSAEAVLPLFRLAEGQARAYAGAGMHLASFSPDVGDSDTTLGGNLVGGIRFERRVLAPMFEVRGYVGGTGQLSALAGVHLFGARF